MIDAVQILWSPAGVTLSALDPLELVDVTDGDTPNLRIPVRMLSVDTPEVTARTDQRAQAEVVPNVVEVEVAVPA